MMHHLQASKSHLSTYANLQRTSFRLIKRQCLIRKSLLTTSCNPGLPIKAIIVASIATQMSTSTPESSHPQHQTPLKQRSKLLARLTSLWISTQVRSRSYSNLNTDPDQAQVWLFHHNRNFLNTSSESKFLRVAMPRTIGLGISSIASIVCAQLQERATRTQQAPDAPSTLAWAPTIPTSATCQEP